MKKPVSPNEGKFCFCVRCGRPIPLDNFINRTWPELPPYCNMCQAHIKTEVAKNCPIWPISWFGHARRDFIPRGAIWRVDVAMFQATTFDTPLYNVFIEDQRKADQENNE